MGLLGACSYPIQGRLWGNSQTSSQFSNRLMALKNPCIPVMSLMQITLRPLPHFRIEGPLFL